MVIFSKRQQVGVWIAACMTAIVGIVNLLSAVTPTLPERLVDLEQIFSFEVRNGGRLFSAISGFILLTLASNILRRKRFAWILTLGFLAISIVSHLVKGLDYEESILSGILFMQLILLRDVFTAHSDRPSLTQGVRVFVGALVFTLAYGAAGFFFLDEHYSRSFNGWEALQQTLAMFLTVDQGGLFPTTRFGQFFADSIYTVGSITLIYACWMLLRPVIFRQVATDWERRRATEIVENYGHSSLARFTLLPDKSYYFSPSGQTVIAYVPKGRGAIALGDPIGPASDLCEAIVGFQEFCARNDWYPAFYQTLPDNIEQYESLGFQVLQIGEEAIVDLKTFTLEGKVGKNLRTAVNKFTKQGSQVIFWEPPLNDAQLRELRAISDEWLKHMQGSEKQFSLGWFDDDYIRGCEIAVVQTKDGRIVAFANVITEYQSSEITIDLMRHRPEAENGTMDFLFIQMFQHLKGQGYTGFNLGLAALAGIGQTPSASRLEKGLKYLYEHLDRFYRFQGLYAYKQKFHPYWEPRYLVFPRLIALPDVMVALIRADSGDRLLDYFKPGN